MCFLFLDISSSECVNAQIGSTESEVAYKILRVFRLVLQMLRKSCVLFAKTVGSKARNMKPTSRSAFLALM